MNNSKRIMAGIASLAMLAGVVAAFPVQPEKVSAEDDVIFSADFEDGKEDGFSRRGEDETVEVVSEGAHGGDNCLSISTRKESWNGPQVALDDVIEAGTQYIVTAYAKTPYYRSLHSACSSMMLKALHTMTTFFLRTARTETGSSMKQR